MHLMKNLPTFEPSIALSLSVWVELMKAFSKVRTREMEWIEAHDLTIGQFGVLELLYHRGEQTIGAVTKLTMSTPGNTTVVIKNLSKRGLIITKKKEGDRRTTLVAITAEGEALIAKIFPQHAQNIEHFFKGLSHDEQQNLRSLLRVLNKSLK